MRIILFTGKGGVGKSTIASATALRVASAGAKTLIMSTDPAHSLADAFEEEVAPEPTEVAGNLYAQQLDPRRRLEENWQEIQRYAVSFLNWAGLADVEAEELSVIPGLDELFALADVKTHHDHGPYDALIVDCAPTGETLRLLSLPDVIQWYMERVFPVERRVVGALRPVARRVTSLPLPDDDVFAAVRRFYERLEGVRRVLTDAETSSVRLVVNPEKMVIAEAMRTFTYLNLFGYRVDAVVANRLLPDVVSDPYFDRWKHMQSRHMATIEEAFSPVPLFRAELKDREPVGRVRLAALGGELYENTDPAELLYRRAPMTMHQEENSFVLSVRVPFARREDLELSSKAGELFLRVGPHRRTIALPRMLAFRPIASAKLEDDTIRIAFEREA